MSEWKVGLPRPSTKKPSTFVFTVLCEAKCLSEFPDQLNWEKHNPGFIFQASLQLWRHTHLAWIMPLSLISLNKRNLVQIIYSFLLLQNGANNVKFSEFLRVFNESTLMRHFTQHLECTSWPQVWFFFPFSQFPVPLSMCWQISDTKIGARWSKQMLGEDVEKRKPELEMERQTRGKESVTRTQDHLSPLVFCWRLTDERDRRLRLRSVPPCSSNYISTVLPELVHYTDLIRPWGICLPLAKWSWLH